MNYKLLFVLCLLAQALFANPSAAELKVLQASEHRYDGYPALGIIFNSALDPGVDYNQFITVNVDEWGSVDGAWVLDKGRHMLYFPHVEPAKTYLVELAAKLPALDRRTLGGTSSHSIKTAAREPFVGFNSQGVILPAKANRGLPIRSYATDAIDLDFFRINHRQAYKFINDRHNYERFLTLRDEHSATLVYSGRFELGLGINQEGVSRIDLSSIDVLNRPGMYVAVLRQPG
ncbi:MAG: hypothetical protein GY731_10315, partial [Gammaproteobacteria bacterium]|nr:hypothetical protein [Gammaproteobacteria bacterium]